MHFVSILFSKNYFFKAICSLKINENVMKMSMQIEMYINFINNLTPKCKAMTSMAIRYWPYKLSTIEKPTFATSAEWIQFYWVFFFFFVLSITPSSLEINTGCKHSDLIFWVLGKLSDISKDINNVQTFPSFFEYVTF